MTEETKLMFAGILFILLVLLGIWTAIYNRLQHFRNEVLAAWADVDAQLKRRHDLVPQLVETVKGYARFEQDLLVKLTEQRSHDFLRESAEEGEYVGAAEKLLVLAEEYPQLRASEHFRSLMRELSVTEDRIAAARRFYNARVQKFNTMQLSFPSSIVARTMNQTPAPFFEVTEIHIRRPSAVKGL